MAAMIVQRPSPESATRPAGPAGKHPWRGGPAERLASGRPREIAPAGGEGGEHGIEALNRLDVAADHEAISALQPPHATARAHVDVVHAAFAELVGPAD